MRCLIVTLFVLILIVGCQPSSHISISNDPNQGSEYSGEAANIIATQQAENAKTKAAYLSDMFKFNCLIWATLAAVAIAGIAFWIFTGSSKGWVIPTASVIGMGLMYGFIEYGKIIALGVLATGLAVIVWKAIEYHQERDAEIAKKVEVK